MRKSLFLINISKEGKGGFTLIEVLIVVLIIGILAAIALPQYQLARDKAKFSTYRSLVKTMADAQRRYYLITGSWTGQLTDLDVEFPVGTAGTVTNGTAVIYDDGYCYVIKPVSGSTSGSVYCGNNNYWGYGEVFANGAGQMQNIYLCTSVGTDARATRLCKALGGTVYGSGAVIAPSGNITGAVYYRITE